MINISKALGLSLKEKVLKKEPTEQIGAWAFSMYYEHIFDIEDDFREFLIGLGTMELGYQFAYTYEKLDKIADDLIAGKKVVL